MILRTFAHCLEGSPLLDVLDTAVVLQPASSLFPGELALDKLINDCNDIVDLTDLLSCAISISQSACTVLDGYSERWLSTH